MRELSGKDAPEPRRVPLARASVVALGVLVALGLVAGLVSFVHRSPVIEPHVAGTEAWPAHLMLFVVAVGWLAWGYRVHRRRDPAGRWLLAPLGSRALTRLRRAERRARGEPSTALRVVACLPFLLVMVYSPFRVGVQVFGGMDPNFTANAWGGPSYLGAMACHVLDTAVMTAVAAVVVDALLPRQPSAAARAGAES